MRNLLKRKGENKTRLGRGNLRLTEQNELASRNLINRSFFLVFLFSCVTILSLVSCSNEKKEEGDKTILHFVTWKANQPEVWDEVIRIFEEEHADIKVKREVGPQSSNAYHDLLTQKLKNRDTSVDVFFMDVIGPPEFGSADWAEPLDRLFVTEKQK